MNCKVMFLGLGVVGQSLMCLLLENNVFSIEDFYVLDLDEKAFEFYLSKGGRRDNCLSFEVDSSNYLMIFDKMSEGDFLLCMADGNDSLILAQECYKRGIHFVSASDDTFDDVEDNEPFRYRNHFKDYKALMKNSENGATSVLQFGVNPGLVSVFSKKALKDIVDNDKGNFVSAKRKQFAELIAAEDYPRLAKELKVRAFVESDLDTTESDIIEKNDTVYSTWNVPDFDGESNDRSIVKVGTIDSLTEILEKVGISIDNVYYYNKGDGTLVFDLSGKEIKTKSNSGENEFEGSLDAHEEVFSLYDYYSNREDEGEIEYAPSVLFVYRPCDLAINSVLHGSNDKYQLITKERMLSGGEAVGICVEGDAFTNRYVGTALYLDESRFETPSVFLVSVSVYAAIKYIIKHPLEGVLFPEYLPLEEILSYVSPYLPIISNEY